jgi:hypothetical protein
MASLRRDIESYERWLHKRCNVVEADLEKKHKRMRKSAFNFLRATYFRWARTIEAVCPDLADAPRVSAVGDIHIENYGTWRDADSRWVWGVNDFDEAAAMPCTFDLIRLATSARLAPQAALGSKAASDAMIEGYLSGLKEPRAYLLGEQPWLRKLAAAGADESDKFWSEIDACPDADPPMPVKRALRKSLPPGAKVLRFASRTQGGGSLGRPRYLVIADWNSGRVVREAKASVPSAWTWAHGKKNARSRLLELAYGEFRAPDPALHIEAGFVIRRIAPDAHKIELSDVAPQHVSLQLLSAMARELGSIHAASKSSKLIVADIEARKASWLHDAASAAEAMTRKDFADFAEAGR